MNNHCRHFWFLLSGLFSYNIVMALPVSNPSVNIPVTVAPGTPVTVPYPGLVNLTGIDKHNYVRTQEPDEPLQTIPPVDVYTRQGTFYFDGLGRSLQSVMKRSHADGHDIIRHQVYDATGKEPYSYLPFIKPDETSYGLFVPNVEARMRQFYDQAGPDEQPYGKTEYDNSPLNRVTRQLAPGAGWVGSNRGTEFAYNTNKDGYYATGGVDPFFYISTGAYPRFTIGGGGADIPQFSGNYAEGELYISTTKDEDGNLVEEVKDKLGRLIIKRSLARKLGQPYPFLAPPEMFPANYAYTLYVYDDIGRLRAVLPPEAAVPAMSMNTNGNTLTFNNTWSLSAAQVSGLCYTYFYDERGRLIEKKIPGKDYEFYVYDKRDRQVLYQDGNLRNEGKVAFTYYDALDRPIATGKLVSALSREALATNVNSAVNFPSTDFFYYIKNYDLYHVYPPQNLAGVEFLRFTYYDDYTELPGLGYDASQFNLNPAVNYTSKPYLVAPQLYADPRGMVTGSKIKVMDPGDPGTNVWLSTVNYYDDKGRLIQSHSQNHVGGVDVSSNIYYFKGMLWKNILKHQHPGALAVPGASSTLNTITLEKTYERNIALGGGNDQVWKATRRINGGIAYEFGYYDYDHLNRPVVKQFPANVVLQEYNIRGFLNHIDVEDHNAASPVPIFEERLHYDKGFASKLYNGNIAGITWSGSDSRVHAYGYSYDRLNRLSHAEYRLQTGAGWLNTEKDYTASNITYDLNGNLLSMNQSGVLAGTGVTNMDKLTYSYLPASNRLRAVEDAVLPATTASLPDFKDGAHSSDEYSYDFNGNMTADQNKGIASITYNHMNKPAVITVTGQGNITYVYDAAGNRLQKRVFDGQVSTAYDYIGDFVYKDKMLQYILNEEGRCRPTTENTNGETRFLYDYFVKDHLGNVRSTVTAEPINPDYLARHELSQANVEQLVFDNIPAVREGKPGGGTGDDMAAHLVASDPNKRVGTAIMLRTMPGDRFNISADAYYDGQLPEESYVDADDVVASLMSTLLGGNTYSGVPLSELPDNVVTIQNTLQNPYLVQELSNVWNKNFDSRAPRAHLNYLFFNDNLELLSELSGAVQVPYGLTGWTTMGPAPSGGNTGIGQVSTTESGYVIIYIDNQSLGKDVWFDNVHIEHYTSSVLEENHYYPFGLTINTSQAGNATENKYLFGTKELEKSFGLNWYDFIDRPYDMQIGRWPTIDKKAEQMRRWSPYAYAYDNPIRFIDPDGMSPKVFVTGEGATEATKQLDKATSLKLSRNEQTGQVSATGKARTPADQKLQDAINDPNVNVNMDATNGNYNKKGNFIVGGTFDGSEVKDGKTETAQTVNPEMAKKIDAMYEMKEGSTMLHETLESYIGGVESPGARVPSYDQTTQEFKNYKNAHDKAGVLDPQYKEPNTSQATPTSPVYISKFPYDKDIPPALNPEIIINDLTH